MRRECLFMSPPPPPFLAPVTTPVRGALNHVGDGGRGEEAEDAVTSSYWVVQSRGVQGDLKSAINDDFIRVASPKIVS